MNRPGNKSLGSETRRSARSGSFEGREPRRKAENTDRSPTDHRKNIGDHPGKGADQRGKCDWLPDGGERPSVDQQIGLPMTKGDRSDERSARSAHSTVGEREASGR